MDDLTEIYIYIYRKNEFQIMTCTTTVSWAPLSWKKLRVKKKTKRKCREILEEKLEIYFKTPFSLFL